MRAKFEVLYAILDVSSLRPSDGVLVDRDSDRFRPNFNSGRGVGVGFIAGIADVEGIAGSAVARVDGKCCLPAKSE